MSASPSDSAQLAIQEDIAMQRNLIIDAWDDIACAQVLLSELQDSDFTDPASKAGYQAIRYLIKTSGSTSVMAVRKLLLDKRRKAEVETLMHHMKTTEQAFLSANHYRSYTQTLLKESMIRKASIALNESQGLLNAFKANLPHEKFPGLDLTHDLVQSEIAKMLDQAFARASRSEAVHWKQGMRSLSERMAEAEYLRQHGDQQSVNASLGIVPTPYPVLNSLIQGLVPQEFTVVAARTNVGKSAWAVQIVESIARSGVHTYLWSGEMAADLIYTRMASRRFNVDRKLVTPAQMAQMEAETEGDLYVDERSCYVDELVRRVHVHKMKHPNLGCLAVDYGQLLGTNEPRVQAEVSKKLKKCLKDLNIPGIVVLQIGRGAENRNEKRPELSDLKESGQWEQDAAHVLTIYKPFMHDKRQPKELAEVWVKKNRYGPVGDCIRYRWDPLTASFYEVCLESTEPVPSDDNYEPNFPWQKTEMTEVDW